MKKILVALLVLALVAPAMADVAITSAFDNTSKNLTISFNPTAGAVVRGVAVTVTVDCAQVDAYVSSSFNTFVDYAFSNPTGYTVGAGNPLALEAVAGVATLPIAVNTPFAVSVGYLDQAGAQAGLSTAGTVAVLHLANINAAGGTVAVTANATRGGAVVGDTVGAVTVSGTTIPTQIVDTITGPAVVTKTTAAPAIATRVNSGRVESFSVSGVTGSSAVEYQFTWGDGTTSAWSTATTATKTYTYAAAAAYNVTVQARLVSNPSMSITSAPLALTTEEFSSSVDSVAYAAWALFGRNKCWAFNRQCRGDSNGRKVGLYAVTSHDLNAMKAAYTKADSLLQTISVDPDGTGTLPPIPGICTDFNKTKVGLYRVTSTDLTVLKTYYTKQDSAVALCPLGAGDGKGIIYYTAP